MKRRRSRPWSETGLPLRQGGMIAIAVSALLLSACGGGEGDWESAEQTPEQAASVVETTFRESPAPVQQNATELSNALQSKEYETAIDQIHELGNHPEITFDQALTLRNTMVTLETEIAAAAAAGDPKAQAALQKLKRMNRN